MPDDDPKRNSAGDGSGVSRRDFLKISGISAAAVPVIGTKVVEAAGVPVKVYGPGKTPVTLNINGEKHTLQVEPRVTLLDAMRDGLDITGAKRVCDRGECGACTVILDGKTVYSCSILAIDAQGKDVTTVESFMQGDQLAAIQQAFVDNDGSQCGFCTPGFIVAAKAFLDTHANPAPDQIQRGLAGNLCRCGTYHGIRHAVAQVLEARGQKGA